MNCMRCGRDTPESQVFCQGCLEKMAQEPVDMDVVVQLPRRKPPAASKKPSRRRALTPEERIAQLRRRVRRLIAAVVALAVALVLLAGFTVHSLRSQQPRPGQNYKTLPPTVATEAASVPSAGS